MGFPLSLNAYLERYKKLAVKPEGSRKPRQQWENMESGKRLIKNSPFSIK